MKYTNEEFEIYSLKKAIERIEMEQAINDSKTIKLVLAVGLLIVTNVFLS